MTRTSTAQAGRRERALALAVASGTALLTVVLGTVSIGTVRLIGGLPVGRTPFPIAVAATALAIGWWTRRRWGDSWLGPAAVVGTAVVVALVAAIGGAGATPDTTYDGQWLHQEAVLQLVEGWNPVHHELSAAELPDRDQRARLNGYPKAGWIAGAAVVALTGHIDHAGWTTIALALAGWALAWAALVGGLGLTPGPALLVSAVLTANPVVLTQALNSQVDGDLAACVTVLALTPWLRLATRSRLVLLAVGAAVVLACGAKLTGGVFAGLFLVGAIVALLTGRRFDGALAVTGGVALVVGMLGLGFNPYVTNLVRHAHPLYPVMGPDAVAIITAPPIGRLKSLAVSIFSRSRHAATSAEAVTALAAGDGLKAPWSVRRAEIEAFAAPDVRIGGFGPLFGAVVIVGGLAVGAWRRAGAGRFLVPLATILVSVLLIPHPWFARFVPQLWLAPLVAALGAMTADARWRRALGLSVVVLAAADGALVAAGHVTNVVRHGRVVQARLVALAGEGVVRVDLRPFLATRARLAELGIEFEAIQDPDRSLQTVLGTWLPRVRSMAVAGTASEREVELSWSRVRGASYYRVELWPGSLATSAAPPLVTLDSTGTSLRAPLPAAASGLTVRACNQLGCGPPVAALIR